MGKRLTQKEFIDKSNIIHKNKYNYDLVVYKNNKSKIIIECPIHGKFEQIPKSHLNGFGCFKCGNNIPSNEKFIEESKKVHGDKYNYQFVNILNKTSKIIIECPIHGKFEQIPKSHLNGFGCFKCGNKTKKSTDYIKLAMEVHNYKYKYEPFILNKRISEMKINIICPKHGTFKQNLNNHVYQQNGCPKCVLSKGEQNIANYLYNNNINFISQYHFSECKNIKTLPFYFYLTDLNICIEFDGIQHFKIIEHWGGNNALLKRQKNDKIKNIFCIENNIKLIRIKYNENIHSILDLNLKR